MNRIANLVTAVSRRVKTSSQALRTRDAEAGSLRFFGPALAGVLLIGQITTSVLPACAEDLPAPPYFISRGGYVVIGIAFDEARAKKLAPSGVQIAPGATGEIIMYTAEESYGLPPYSSAWLGIDVDGFDTPAGNKARWMISGLYGPMSVTNALAKYFDYPTREGSTRVEREGRRVTAVATMGGREMIRAELILKTDLCVRGSGLIHEVTRKAGSSAMQLIKIPYVSDWCAADSVKVDIVAPASDPFGQAGAVKVLWGGYSYGGFGWSPALTVH